MPELTPQQSLFVKEYVIGSGNGAEAARKAGYSERSAAKLAHQLMDKRHIQEAIHRAQRQAFTELASISLGQAKKMLEDDRTPAGARVELIKTMMDRAGLAAVRDDGKGSDPSTKDLRAMSMDELLEIAASFREKRAADAAE